MTDGNGQSDPEHRHPPHKGQQAVKATCSSPIRGTEKRRAEERRKGPLLWPWSGRPNPLPVGKLCWSVSSVGESTALLSEGRTDQHQGKFFLFL